MTTADNNQDRLQELQRAVSELRVLNEIAVSISATIGVQHVIELMLRKCIHHIGAEQGAVWLLDSEGEEHRVRTLARIMEEDAFGVPYKISASVTGWILKNRGPLLINDLSSDSRFGDLLRDHKSMRSLLAVPLTLQNRIIGILCLFNQASGRSFTSDDARLLSIVAIQSAQTVENARLYEEEKALYALKEDLRVATQIQQSLLPKHDPVLDGFEIVGTSLPAQEVGGDYFDFVELDDGGMGIAVGDVSGKGVPAAMLMASLQSCLRSQAVLAESPRVAVTKINSMFTRFVDPGRFVTLIYGQLDPAKRTFTYVNAGHTYPIIVRQSGDVEMKENSDLIIGVNEQANYNEITVTLSPGELLVLCSDGVTEATARDGEFLGTEPVMELVKAHRELPTDQIVSRLLKAVRDFMGDSHQSDDITLVLIKAL